MERINSIEVEITIDTTSATTKKKLIRWEYDENETRDEFIERVKETINNNLPE